MSVYGSKNYSEAVKQQEFQDKVLIIMFIIPSESGTPESRVSPASRFKKLKKISEFCTAIQTSGRTESF